MGLLSKNTPFLDLHGESSDIARCLIKEFILDNYTIGKERIIIIHGKGQGIIKKTIHDELKHNKLVDSYYIDFFNDGQTIVKLKIR